MSRHLDAERPHNNSRGWSAAEPTDRAHGPRRVAAQQTPLPAAFLSRYAAGSSTGDPWVPRRLVTHGYCCLGATRLAFPSVILFAKDGMNQIGSLPDQQADSRDDRENRRHKAELPKRNSKGADDTDEDQINREEEHSDVLFHSVQFRIVTAVPILAAL